MEFQEITKKIENFGKDLLLYWSNALAGEVGELCNLVKKWERDGAHTELWRKMGLELADIFIYCVLFARKMDMPLEDFILEKIEIVRLRRVKR